MSSGTKKASVLQTYHLKFNSLNSTPFSVIASRYNTEFTQRYMLNGGRSGCHRQHDSNGSGGGGGGKDRNGGVGGCSVNEGSSSSGAASSGSRRGLTRAGSVESRRGGGGRGGSVDGGRMRRRGSEGTISERGKRGGR